MTKRRLEIVPVCNFFGRRTQRNGYVPASNDLSCYAHCILCDEDFLLVMVVETTFAGMSSKINTTHKGKANGQQRKQNFAITKLFAASLYIFNCLIKKCNISKKIVYSVFLIITRLK